MSRLLSGILTGLALGLFLSHLLGFLKITSNGSWRHVSVYRQPAAVTRIVRWKKHRMLCWVVLPDDFDSDMTRRARLSWGRTCTKLVLFSMDDDPVQQIIGHHYAKQHHNDNWNVAHHCWSIIHDRFASQFDWFAKIHLQSFFSPRNFLRHAQDSGWTKPTQQLVYAGATAWEQRSDVTLPDSQYAHGVGYVISQALLLVIAPYLPSTTLETVSKERRCGEWVRVSDAAKFADCLREVLPGYTPNRTTDEYGREVFLPLEPDMHLSTRFGGGSSWYWLGKVRGLNGEKLQCCSSRPALFHAAYNPVSTKWSFFLDYMYHVVLVDPR